MLDYRVVSNARTYTVDGHNRTVIDQRYTMGYMCATRSITSTSIIQCLKVRCNIYNNATDDTESATYRELAVMPVCVFNTTNVQRVGETVHIMSYRMLGTVTNKQSINGWYYDRLVYKAYNDVRINIPPIHRLNVAADNTIVTLETYNKHLCSVPTYSASTRMLEFADDYMTRVALPYNGKT